MVRDDTLVSASIKNHPNRDATKQSKEVPEMDSKLPTTVDETPTNRSSGL